MKYLLIGLEIEEARRRLRAAQAQVDKDIEEALQDLLSSIPPGDLVAREKVHEVIASFKATARCSWRS